MFVVIGAMKGGTTSLYYYLASHPDVCVSSVKETNYFLGREEFQRGIDWYASQFEANDKVMGEASPNYTKRHVWPGVPERMFRALPHAKLIYVVRDPVERVVSHYVHNYAKGRERRPFWKAVVRDSNYIKTSMYAFQMEAFLEYYPDDQILVVAAEEMQTRRKRVLRRILHFIEIEGSNWEIDDSMQYNTSEGKTRPSFLDRHVNHLLLRKMLRRLLPPNFSERRALSRPVMSEEIADYLRTAIGPDAARFRRLTGESFDTWSV